MKRLGLVVLRHSFVLGVSRKPNRIRVNPRATVALPMTNSGGLHVPTNVLIVDSKPHFGTSGSRRSVLRD